MNAESFLQSFNAALDAVAQNDFDFSAAGELFPSSKQLSTAERLQVIRDFDLQRPEFYRKDPSSLPEIDVSAEVLRVDQAMERLAFDLVEEEATRDKLVSLAKQKLLGMRPDSPYYDRRDQLHAGLVSNDQEQIVHALFHVDINSQEWDDFVRGELAATNGPKHELRKSQFSQTLAAYQAAKRDLVGSCFVFTMLWTLRHADEGVPTRDMLISGLRGLNRAIDKFDSKRAFAFPTYASWWIRQALIRAILDLRGWKLRDLDAFSEMRKIIGKERWDEWCRSPNPDDVAPLGLTEPEIVHAIERGRDTNIYPIHLGGNFLTPECVGDEREWVTLSQNVTTDTNPVWWV